MMDLTHGVHDWKDIATEVAGSYIVLAVYNALLQALPEPMPMERWYGFAYRFLNLLGVNISKLRK